MENLLTAFPLWPDSIVRSFKDVQQQQLLSIVFSECNPTETSEECGN